MLAMPEIVGAKFSIVCWNSWCATRTKKQKKYAKNERNLRIKVDCFLV